jgi:hypothetical protein
MSGSAIGQTDGHNEDSNGSSTELNCSDSLDNDGDTVFDCADADCFDAPECSQKTGREQTDAACQDFIDNDDDGYLDCEDHDCLVDEVTVCVGSWGSHVPIQHAAGGSQPTESTFEEDTRESKSGWQPSPAVSDRASDPEASLDDAAFPLALVMRQAQRQTRFYRDLSYTLPKEFITAIAVDPGDPENILAGLDGFLFKSDDRGESWRPVLSFPRGAHDDLETQGGQTTNQILPKNSGDSTALLALPSRVFSDGEDESDDDLDDFGDDSDEDEEDWEQDFTTSEGKEGDWDTDQGWMPEGDDAVFDDTQIHGKTGAGVRQIRYQAANRGTVYVATPRGLFRSTDGGESFSKLSLPGGADANDVRDVAMDPSESDRVWVGSRVGLFISDDGGRHFNRVAGRAGQTPILAIWTGQRNGTETAEEDLILLGTDEGMMRSWDGGISFHDLLLQGVGAYEPISQVAFDPRGEITYAGSSQGLFVSERGQPILERRVSGQQKQVTCLSVDPLRPRGIIFGFKGDGIFFSDDAGLSTLQIGRDLSASTISQVSRWDEEPDAIFLATDRGVFVYDKGRGISVNVNRIRELEDIWYREPTLPETMSLALDYSALHSEVFYSAFQRAGWSAFAPELRAQYRYSGGRPEEEEEYILLVDEPDDFDDEDEKDFLELYDVSEAARAPYRGQVHKFFVTLTWDLDQLAFGVDRPRVMRLSPLRHRAEMQVLSRVRSLYTARRRLITEMVLQGTAGSERLQMAQWLKLAELTALVDGATGGGFSRIARERKADGRFIFILESDSQKEAKF